jgi:serine protease AprX
MVTIKSVLSIVFLTLAIYAQAQVNRYMVYFKNKTNSAYSVSQPLAYLSQRAIDRRTKNEVAITETDFPVNANYIADLQSAGTSVIYTSKWFNAALVQCEASLVTTIEGLASVSKVALASPGMQAVEGTTPTFFRARQTSYTSSKTYRQLHMLGIDSLHALGSKGEGIKVAVFDSGFPGVNTTAAFAHLQDNIVDTYDFVHNNNNVYAHDDHGTEVLSVMAAVIDTTFIGGAYNASYHLYITEDAPTEYRIEEYNWLFAAERADSIGVDVINASLGYNTFDDASMDYTRSQLNGNTAVVTRAAQLAADRGIFVVVSGGNEGNNSWGLVTPPADAVGVVAAGSVTSTEIKSPFSSVGPTSDGRIKPDLCAMGSGTFVVRETGNTGTTSGTSVASPLLASLITCLTQRFDTLSKDELLSALKVSASQGDNPDNILGYGIPNFVAFQNYMEAITKVEEPVVKAFTIFPNPVNNGVAYIQSLKTESNLPVIIRVIDAQGRLLQKMDFTFDWLTTRAEINLSDFPSGLLIVQINSGNQTGIFKIIKVR